MRVVCRAISMMSESDTASASRQQDDPTLAFRERFLTRRYVPTNTCGRADCCMSVEDLKDLIE
jgi:hypothetical protein